MKKLLIALLFITSAIAAWALAGLTEGIVFDPQEEFFADAESFWEILMDESLGDEGCSDEGDDEDDAVRPPDLRILPPPGDGAPSREEEK